MTKEEIKEMEHKLSVNSSKSTDLNGHIMVLNEVKPKGKVLYLQLDNVYRENKKYNRCGVYVLSCKCWSL